MAVSNIELRVDARQAVSALGQVNRASSQLDGAVNQLQRSFGNLAASLGAGFALSKAISDVKELDTNIRRLGTVGVDVAKINPALSKLSDELGGVASKAELAAASYQAASAGFSDTAGNINILRAATKAAVGGLADTTAVTEVLVKTLNSYGMSGDQALQVTDSISKAVELGNQEWSDYTTQLGRVASVAALAGVSLNELNAFISAATLNGATAEIAFTGLSAVLTQLLQPSKESQDAAAELGVQFNIAGLRAKGLTGLMKDLVKAIDKDKEAASRMVGSSEAMRGAFAAASKDGKDFERILTALGGATGKTEADFQIMKGSLENTLKSLDTAFKNLSEALGKAFGPTLVITIQDLTKAVNNFAAAMQMVPQPVLDTAGALVKALAQLLLVQKALQAIIGLNRAFTAAMVSMAAATASTGTAATSSASSFALYTANARTLQAASVSATASVSGLSLALLNLAGIGIVTVGVNYVFTQTGQILGSAGAAGASRKAGLPAALAAQLKGKSAAERKQLLIVAQKNLKNDEKLARTLEAKIGMQRASQTGPEGGPLPSDLAELTAIQQRIKTNQARIRAIQTLPLDTTKPQDQRRQEEEQKRRLTEKEKREAERARKKAEEDARMVAESARALDVSQRDFAIQEQLVAAQKDKNDALVVTRQAQQELLAINAKAAEILANKEIPAQAKLNQIESLKSDAKKVSLDLSLKLWNLEEEQRKKIEEQVKLGQERQQSLADEFALLQAKINGNEAEVILQQQLRDITKDTAGLDRKAVEDQLRKIQTLKDQVRIQEQIKAVYTDIGMSIKSGITDAIQGAIDGTKTLGDVANQVLRTIGNKLLDVAVNMALFGEMSGTGKGGGLLGSLFKPRANGGSVMAGQSYLVGERGPELFTPGRSGGIAPSGSFGAVNVVVNVDASGGNVQGGGALGAAMGRVVTAAVQAELIKQKRAGGILS